MLHLPHTFPTTVQSVLHTTLVYDIVITPSLYIYNIFYLYQILNLLLFTPDDDSLVINIDELADRNTTSLKSSHNPGGVCLKLD